MWVTVLLIGWFVTSLLVGPWVGRFVSTHARVREEAPSKMMTPETDPAKPLPIARRA